MAEVTNVEINIQESIFVSISKNWEKMEKICEEENLNIDISHDVLLKTVGEYRLAHMNYEQKTFLLFKKIKSIYQNDQKLGGHATSMIYEELTQTFNKYEGMGAIQYLTKNLFENEEI